MSTRSNIGVMNIDGTVTGVYCHHDGYPSHHVPLLAGHYATEALARALVAPGDMSVLAENVGERHPFGSQADEHQSQCDYYGRDRGEKNTGPREYPTRDLFDAAATHDFAYLFVDGVWLGRRHGGSWMKIANLLRAEAEEE